MSLKHFVQPTEQDLPCPDPDGSAWMGPAKLEESWCTGCGRSSLKPIPDPFLACCPDSRYRTGPQLVNELRVAEHSHQLAEHAFDSCSMVLDNNLDLTGDLEAENAVLKRRIEDLRTSKHELALILRFEHAIGIPRMVRLVRRILKGNRS
ncbi:MAG TPA: hypothetical protein PKY05_06780 [Fibrobacteria bacterium]|nr:hypothetical protein [Fibrobacteria bacterium]